MAARHSLKKAREMLKSGDDSLFGLLSSYKIYNTYFQVVVSKENDRIAVLIAGNPKSWENIPLEKYKNYVRVRRLELGVNRLNIKYLSPQHIIMFYGPILGLKLPSNKVTFINNLDKDGYFILETSLKYMPLVFQNLKRLINLPPQKKYEILEKFIAEAPKG